MPILTKKDFWNPNTNYTKNNRIQSLISYDDELYLCIETHKSEDTFDETKFSKVVTSSEDNNEEPTDNETVNTFNTTLDITESPITVNIQEENEDTIITYNDITIDVNSSTEVNNKLIIEFNYLDNLEYITGKNYFIRINTIIDLEEGVLVQYGGEPIYTLSNLPSNKFIELVVTNLGFTNDIPKFKIINSYINDLPV